MLRNILVLCLTIIISAKAAPREEFWTGKWFPHDPQESDDNPVVTNTEKPDLYDGKHGIVMGVKDKDCDDAKTNLQIDWYMNPKNYTCYDQRSSYLPKGHIHPIHSVEHIPKLYNAPHKCMNESLHYNEIIPTYGAHRPLWAVYGEYTFLPRQRWIHNLEHGSLVMLYHPCANRNEVNLLRKIVNACLYRHVITPYNLLSKERPLALITWGNRLEMSKVAPEVVLGFIKNYALKGPEKTHRDGQYSFMLEKHAKIVSNIDDDVLCPNYSNDGIIMK